MNKYLPTSYREPVTDQSKDITEVRVGEPMSFPGISTQIYGWGVNYRCKNDSKTADHQRPIPAWVTADES